MRDSYERFFSQGYISKEQFFDFGIRETIYAPLDKAKACWEKLKRSIKTNQPVYIRKYGGRNNTNGNFMFQEFYKHVLGNENVRIDRTNNTEPNIVIHNMTGYSKKKILTIIQSVITKSPIYLVEPRISTCSPHLGILFISPK